MSVTKTDDITVDQLVRNAAPARLYEYAIREEGSKVGPRGELVAFSGKKTGRSPLDKRIVISKETLTPADPQSHSVKSCKGIWWGEVNKALSADSFEQNKDRALTYLNRQERLFVVDGFAGWDPRYRLKVRVYCRRAYHALFMHNMLIRPTTAELDSFSDPDYIIYNAGEEKADPSVEGLTSDTSVCLNFATHEIVILGTEYAGEMKKGVFTVMNYLMPKAGHLSMHCSATEPKEESGELGSILFGLSGTGKTTLSSDPKRALIGDDEHVWTDQGVFNIEGGCYAKMIDLSPEKEPGIFSALKFGTVLENVVLDSSSGEVDFSDTSITKNTRGSYPIEFAKDAKIPCVGPHPGDVIFLTCDAFGVLPPVSKLDRNQAMYHFISGYTAKVAGTEMGVNEPQATFSPCFGGPFMVWHPGLYAEILAKKLQQHNANCWLVNTGWSGGGYGEGQRMPLHQTRAIIDSIHNGSLAMQRFEKHEPFGLMIPTQCQGVPPEVLDPQKSWKNELRYLREADRLAQLFEENFSRYSAGVSIDVRRAGPTVSDVEIPISQGA
jgi:phosphoenolpyruvate carboxykinase (ATP)